MGFSFEKLAVPEVVHIQPDVFSDDRGAFAELYKQSEFMKNGLDVQFVQCNNSVSKKNVLRGLHYQIHPKAQGKLIGVAVGEVFDVAVDIRRGSPTFGTWVAKELTARDKNMLFIPPGFAHGFAVVSDSAEIMYYCTGEYSREHERGIIWNDSQIGIEWPVRNPILSDRDGSLPSLAEAENNFQYE